MKLSELKEAGGFVSAAPPVKVDVTWKKEDEELQFSVFVRKLPFGEVERMYQDHDDRSRGATVISKSIILDSEERLTYDQAYDLDSGLALALLNAVNSVNKGEPKNSPPPTSSGTT